MFLSFSRIFLISTALISTAIPKLFAAPTINGVANAASNIAFNSPVAPGGIFVIYGTDLGPANLVISPTPFQNTTVSGTSVTVTVGSTTVNALMYYTSATQVAALLPSSTPIPTQASDAPMFTVTFNGQTSAPANHGIAKSNLGIFTVDSSGQGPGIVTFSDYSLVSAGKTASCGGPYTACGSANPGDTLILWGTGLGPVSGDDASGLGQNMPNVPLTLWLGGAKANILYQGRSGCCIGEDQVVFTVPDNVPTGCAVPLVVQIGTNTNTISNTTVMAIATGSRNCTPTNPAVASINVEQAVMAGQVSYGFFELDRFLNNNGPGFQDSARFEFGKSLGYKPGSEPFFVSYLDNPPLGTCIVYGNVNGPSDPPFSDVAPLDGGSSFTIRGPNGTIAVQGGGTKVTLSAAGTFLIPGAYTITGTGGADVGAFTANFTITQSPTLLSPTAAANLAFTRSNGLTVTWNGNGSTGNVEIFMLSALDNMFSFGSMANCRVAASAGTFTIPPYVLLALPAGNFTQFELSPGIISPAVSASFTASGINLGLVEAFIDGTAFGGFALR